MFEAYSVGIRLRLIDGVSAGLFGLASQFQAFNRHVNTSRAEVKALEADLARLRTMGMVGGITMGIGMAGLYSLKAPLEEAKKFQTEVARFAALGYGDATNKQAVSFANGMNIMGASVRENLKMVREATAMTGDFGHALVMAPQLLKMKFGLESVMGEKSAGSFDAQIQAAMKVPELRGALVNRETGKVDPARFSAVLDKMVQAYVASGGRVTPRDYLAAMKTGGVSAKLMDDDMFFFGLGHFMQESGGSRVGTASMSMFQSLAMGRMGQQTAEWMAQHKLLDPKAIHYGTTGHITKVDPMGVVNAKLFTANPYEWMNTVAVPLLQSQGFKGNDLNIALAQMLHVRTASNLADQMVRENVVAKAYIERAGHAANVDQLYNAGGKTLAGKERNLEAQWETAKTHIGQAVLPLAISFVNKLTAILEKMNKFATSHPRIFSAMVDGFLALSALFVVGGAAMLITTGFKALGLAMMISKGVGIGSMLMEAAGGFQSVGVALGKMGLVGAAGAGGYWLGTQINKLGPDGDLGGAIGNWAYDHLSREADHPYDPNATGRGHYARKGSAGGAGPRVIQLNVDGRRLAEVVTPYQARWALGSQTGVNSFDLRMNQAPAGAF